MNNFLRIISIVILVTSGFGILIILSDLGFSRSNIQEIYLLRSLLSVCVLTLFGCGILKMLLEKPKRTKKKKIIVLIFQSLTGFFLFFIVLFFVIPHFSETIPSLSFLIKETTLIWLFLVIFLLELSRRISVLYKKIHSPATLFIISFLGMILLGTCLLMIPGSTRNGISAIDALFISTSAVCVTGLSTIDQGTSFTLMGYVFLLILIQLGGIGILTFTSFLALFFKDGFSFHNRIFVKDVTNANKLNEVVGILHMVMLFTLGIEILGAFLIFIQLDSSLMPSLFQRVFFSFFHSISAFCNAGFSTYTDGLYDIKIRYLYGIHIVIAVLIILGGLGYTVIFNILIYLKNLIVKNTYILFDKKFFFKIYNRNFLKTNTNSNTIVLYNINMGSKIVLISTGILLAFGTLMVFMLEYNNTLTEHTLYGKIVISFFSSVTPRTAGFNTIDFGLVHNSTVMIIILLMWIGASPGSTGGGIKTSTFFICILNLFNILQGKDRIEFSKREIPYATNTKAFSIIIISLLIIGTAVFFILLFDPELPFVKVCFESFSAYGTVGLSMGITQKLSTASKFIIIILMFLGRVGSITLLVAFVKKVKTLKYRYPTEEIFIN
ncbi:MAG: potassium transporter TrkG [Chitinophagaceae bacterium]|nr:potassium transporter TrkG [Chitinophagaceae bacterium]